MEMTIMTHNHFPTKPAIYLEPHSINHQAPDK